MYKVKVFRESIYTIESIINKWLITNLNITIISTNNTINNSEMIYTILYSEDKKEDLKKDLKNNI
jgi:hypothetical protein